MSDIKRKTTYEADQYLQLLGALIREGLRHFFVEVIKLNGRIVVYDKFDKAFKEESGQGSYNYKVLAMGE